MLRQSRSRPITPNRQNSNNSVSNSNSVSVSNSNSNSVLTEAKKLEEKLAERRSSSSVTRSPIGLKPTHWSKELKEVTVVTQQDGVFNFRIVGGSDHGEFPVVVEVLPPDTRGVEYHSEGELTTQVMIHTMEYPSFEAGRRNYCPKFKAREHRSSSCDLYCTRDRKI